MISLVAAAIMAPLAVPLPADTMCLSRTYKEGETQNYTLHVEVDQSGAKMVIDSEVIFKVKKPTADGAEIAMSVRGFKMTRDGTDVGQTGPEELVAGFDKFGMPQTMSVDSQAWVYILAAFSGLVPGKDVAIGNGFDINWQTKNKQFSANGKGKALEIVEHEGAKAVKLDYDVEVHPDQDQPGHVKCQTMVALDGIAPISAVGTVDVDGMSMKFSIKRKKA